MATIDIQTEVSLYRGTGTRKFDIEYDASLVITRQGCADFIGGRFIEWCNVFPTPKEAVDTQIAILEGIIEDCQEHIEKLKKNYKKKKEITYE